MIISKESIREAERKEAERRAIEEEVYKELKILTSKEKDVLQNIQTQAVVETINENKTPAVTATPQQENLKPQKNDAAESKNE